MTILRVDVDSDGVALAVIDDPSRPINVLTPEFQTELSQLIDRIASDPAIKSVILTSGKRGTFIAGADLKDIVHSFARGLTAREAADISKTLNPLLRRLETCGKPVVAAINGTALGGGLEVALACHGRILATNAVVGLPEVTLGLLPAAGGTQRVPRLIGIEAASTLMLTGKPIKAEEALKLGLVQAVAEPEALLSRAREWLLRTPRRVQPWDEKGYRIPGGGGPMAPHAMKSFTAGTAQIAQSTQRNYPAPLAILSCLYEGTQVPLEVGLRIESKYFGRLLSGPVARNLIRTLFVNKGEADKLARRPRGPQPTRVQRIGILGAGMMGSGIAYSAAAAGIEVVLLDTTIAAADKGKRFSAQLLEKAVERGTCSAGDAEAHLARIKPTSDFTDLRAVDLVVEAVFEDTAVKADVTRQADAVIPSTTMLASNTSTLPISDLAKAFSRSEDFVGLHFFSPVDKMPLVEVIVGKKTSSQTLARGLDFVAQLKKTPIVVNDSPGFFTSRVFATYIQEGALLLEEGVAPALIENAARRAGFAVGPLAVADEVTLELQLNIIQQNAASDALSTPHMRRVLKVLRHMVHSLKRIGRRGGAGYYDYPPGGKKVLWPGLAHEFPIAAEQPSVEQIGHRLLSIQALEAARCAEENVVMHVADADLGSILGIGFPSWTGGVLSYVDMLGIQVFVAKCEALADKCGPRFSPSDWLRARAAARQPFHA